SEALEDLPDVNHFARGGEYDGDRKIEDLKLLYRAYVVNALSSGRMEINKIAALNQLGNIFGLVKREAEAITLDVTSRHLGDDGELSDKDAAALLRLRIMLCVPQQTIDAAHSDICGSWFEKVVKDTIASGVDGYGADIWKSVRKAAHGLRLTRDTAMSIASKTIRKIFINFIQRARAAGNHTESAKELKKMIAFNTLVVTELVNGIKEESDDESTEEPGKEGDTN
ncbi:Protein TIC110, chloroplastic, partial [Glycine soja]